MLRNVTSKVMWVGRATVFLVGLAVILALVLGVASTAFGSNGQSFSLGRINVASAVSTLVKQGPGPALDLQVDSGPPLAVNSSTKVTNLNADQLDGKSDTDFYAKGSKVADSELLDGKDSTAFWSGKSYVDYSDPVSGVANTFTYAQMDCDQGDSVLGGGYAFDGTAHGYEVLMDRIGNTRDYEFAWKSDDTPDIVTISVTCADFPPLRP